MPFRRSRGGKHGEWNRPREPKTAPACKCTAVATEITTQSSKKQLNLIHIESKIAKGKKEAEKEKEREKKKKKKKQKEVEVKVVVEEPPPPIVWEAVDDNGVKPPFEAKLRPGKGFGLFATEAIKRGTRILDEAPFLTVDDYGDKWAVYQAFQALTPALQRYFRSLSTGGPHRQNHQNEAAAVRELQEHHRWDGEPANAATAKEQLAIYRIFETNVFFIGGSGGYSGDGGGGGGGDDAAADHWNDDNNGGSSRAGANYAMFAQTSRMNHSCVPNAHFAWNPSHGRQAVHALRDIAVGEEITVSYIPALMSSIDRMVKLRGSYGFECDCRACFAHGSDWVANESNQNGGDNNGNLDNGASDEETDFQLRSNSRRYKIQEDLLKLERFRKYPRRSKLAGPAEAVALSIAAAELAKEEGLQYRVVADCYDYASLYCEMLDDLEAAYSWSEKQLDVELACLGDDHPIVDERRQRLTDLKERIADKPATVAIAAAGVVAAAADDIVALRSPITAPPTPVAALPSVTAPPSPTVATPSTDAASELGEAIVGMTLTMEQGNLVATLEPFHRSRHYTSYSI